MKNAKRAFRDILLLELDDLGEDIHDLIDVCAERHRNDEITNYVHKENTAFFHNEMLGIKGFYEDVKTFDIDIPMTVQDMASALKILLEQRVTNHDLAPALIPLVERKIEKVLSYVRPGGGPLSSS